MENKPNIVLIIMDTARAKNFPMYGYEKNTTPFLNELSKKSVVYQNAYSNAPWTLPSHATLFTGKLLSEHLTVGWGDKLNNLETLAEKLKKKGYYTLGISNNGWVSKTFGLDKGFDEFIPNFFTGLMDEDFRLKLMEVRNKNYSVFRKGFEVIMYYLKKKDLKKIFSLITYFSKRKLRFFSDKGATYTNKLMRKKVGRLKEPFFVFLNYVEPHDPYKAPKNIEKKFLNKYQMKQTKKFKKNTINYYHMNLTKEDKKIIEGLYDSGLYYMDLKIKELYSFFKKNDLEKNTIFIFTSDHGEYLGEHNLFMHAWDIQKEVLKIPLIIKYPDNIPKKIKKTATLIDVFDLIINNFEFQSYKPTISEYYGLATHFKDIYKKFDWLSKEKIDWGNQYMASLIIDNYQFITKESGISELIELQKEEKVVDKNISNKFSKKIEKILGDVKRKRTIYLKRKSLKEKLKKLKLNKSLNKIS